MTTVYQDCCRCGMVAGTAHMRSSLLINTLVEVRTAFRAT